MRNAKKKTKNRGEVIFLKAALHLCSSVDQKFKTVALMNQSLHENPSFVSFAFRHSRNRLTF